MSTGSKFGPFAWMADDMTTPRPNAEQAPAPQSAATFRGWVEVDATESTDGTRYVQSAPVFVKLDDEARAAALAEAFEARAIALLPSVEPAIADRALAALMSGDRARIVADVAPYDRRSVEEAQYVPVLSMLGIEDHADADNDAAESPLPRFETTAGYRMANDGTYRTARKLRNMTIVGRTLPARTAQRPYVRHFSGGYLQAAADAITALYRATDVVSDAFALRHQADAILRGTGDPIDAALTRADGPYAFGTEDRMFNQTVTHKRDDARALLQLERECVAALDEARGITHAGKRRKAINAASRHLAEIRLALQSPEVSESGVSQRRLSSALVIGGGSDRRGPVRNGDVVTYPALDRSGKSLVTVRKATARDLALVADGFTSKRHQMNALHGEPRQPLEPANAASVTEHRTTYRRQYVQGHGKWEVSGRGQRQLMSAAIASEQADRTVENLREAVSNRLASHATPPGTRFSFYSRTGEHLSIEHSAAGTYRVSLDRPGFERMQVRGGRDSATCLAAVNRALAASPQVKADRRRKVS